MLWCFGKFIDRKSTKRGHQLHPILSFSHCQACCLLLAAFGFLKFGPSTRGWIFFFVRCFKWICYMVRGYFTAEPLHRTLVQPIMKLFRHWTYFAHIFPFNQELCYTGGPFILALWPCRPCIATRVIVVYIPQLTTPDPRSIAKSLRLRAYQVRDLLTVHNGSGISSGCDLINIIMSSYRTQPEVVPWN